MQTATAKTVRIDVHPHPGQAEVHADSARFKVLAAGRRWGKTRLGVHECLEVASNGGRAWWVAPTYKMSEVGWRPLHRMGAKIGAEIRRADRQIILPNGGEVTVRSADNPDSLRGEGLDLVVIDEAAFVSPDAWNYALRPALSDRLGRGIFISTPKGHNWFWMEWNKGAAGDPDYSAWQLPTRNNPYIAPDEIETARKSLPERIFQQEYLAEFIEDAGGVFRGVLDAAVLYPQDPIEGHEYVFGVDWGKHNDFTVIWVLDSTAKEAVFMDRFNQIDYRFQVGRLQVLYDKYRPVYIRAEANSMGDPVIERLIERGMSVVPFTTTNASKKEIIERLALAFERKTIKIINDPTAVAELQAYEAERLPSGMFRYSAPEGMHDDTVMALALAWSGVAEDSWVIW